MRPRTRLLLCLAGGAALAALAAGAEGQDTEYPRRVLDNGAVRLTVYLPDARRGYYRAARFDWSGMIARAEYRGHRYFSQWRTPHDPTNFEHALGPCDEFGSPVPLAYAESRPGESFIKIGIGHLERIEEPRYRFSQPYRIVRPGTWETRAGKDRIEFRQELSEPRGWGYRYEKVVALTADGFEIARKLRNIGSRSLETNTYNHNFLTIDDDRIGPDYTVTLPFAVPERRPLKDMGAIEGREIRFNRAIPEGDAVFSEVPGHSGRVEDHGFTVRNRRTGAGLRVAGDASLAKMNFYAAPTAICPEPFVDLKLAPGAERAWTSRYTFLVER